MIDKNNDLKELDEKLEEIVEEMDLEEVDPTVLMSKMVTM